MAKSTWITYLLWLFLGWTGLHHFYLRRDKHAFVWFATSGGFFGLGWIQDSWRIPRYVREANLSEREYGEKVKELERKYPKRKPPHRWSMSFAQLTFGSMLGYLVLAAIPEEPIYGYYLYDVLFWLMPVAVALGVYTCGNFGAQEGKIKWALYGALAMAVVIYTFNVFHGWTSVVSTTMFNWKEKKWRYKRSKPNGFLKRVAILFGCSMLYYSLFFSYLYFNVEIQDSNGDTIKLRDSVANFLKSPMWIEFKESFMQLKNYAKVHGWRRMWDEFIEKMDPHGEKNALKELGLEANATQKDIHNRFKQLSREWHPDRHRTPEAKADAQEKFIVIQQAYELLSDIKRRRKQRNRA